MDLLLSKYVPQAFAYGRCEPFEPRMTPLKFHLPVTMAQNSWDGFLHDAQQNGKPPQVWNLPCCSILVLCEGLYGDYIGII